MSKGFTLVELSIVLVIIGLLIGGILVAQSLIESTKVALLANNLSQYEAAVKLFKMNYKKYPGDSSYFTPGGDADGSISGGVGCDGLYSNVEYYQVWAHLSQSGMLDENYETYSPDACGGPHNDLYDWPTNKDVVWPYTYAPSAIDALGGVVEFPISTSKSSGSNFLFSYTLEPLESLALESKMSSQPYNASGNQVGLVNNYGAMGTCVDNITNPVLCTDSSAAYGNLYYYLAP